MRATLGGFAAAALAALLTLVIAPTAQAATWPQYTSPTDTHETNSAWYPFKDTAGTAVGDAQLWVGNSPTDLTNELNVSLGMANYGTTDVFYCDGSGQLYTQPWDLTTVPNAPTASQSGSTLVVATQTSGVGYLGVCEIGGTAPDVLVFYVKGDPTLSANRATLYWRQISESWQAEHSVAMPADFCAGSSWDQVPSAGSTWFLHGKVVALNDAFAFVSMSSGEVDTYVTNLQTPGSDGAMDEATAWQPFTASYLQVRDIDAIPFAYKGSTYLAVSALYGEPTTNYDFDWGTIIKGWDGMQAVVRVCSVGSDGSCAAASSTSFAVGACPDPGPSTNGSGLTGQSGAVNIRLVRGGVTDGPTGDTLTVMTRTFGSLNRWLLSAKTHVENHYTTIQPELLDAYEISVDQRQTTPTLATSAERYSGWQRRGLMSDGSNDLYEAGTVYVLQNAEGLAQRNFFVTTLVADDPNGPTNPSTITPSPSPSPLVYGSERQRIVWATATQLHAHGYNVKNLDDLSDYPGVVGTVGYLDSDALQPVKTDTTDQNGNPLPTPITYPYPISADSSDLQLIGIIYGTPPTSLNNNPQGTVFPTGNGTNYYSSVLFGNDVTAGTTTSDVTEGGAGFALKAEGEGEHGLKFPFEPELSWTTDREDVSSNALSIAIKETWWPGPDPAETPTGYALFKQISDFELQRYTRLDWDGGEIGNGVSESVFVTNPLPSSSNGPVVKHFVLTGPDADPMFAGMASRPDTLSWQDWHGVDPLSQAQTGGHGDLFDSSNGGTRVTLSHDAGGGYAAASFTESQAEQNDVVSNGVSAELTIPFFTGDYSFTHKVVDTTTTNTTTQVSLGLAQPPEGQEAGTLTSITVTAYWLRANDADAYWIPDAFRTNGNYQTPWCIDYQLTSYEVTPSASAGSAPGTAEAPQCRVAVQCSPASGGSARVFNQERTAAGAVLGSADGAGQLISATPAPGFRFIGWRLYGKRIARIADTDASTTSVSALANGGVTAVAQFERVVPRRVQVVRHTASSYSVTITGAPLWDDLRQIKPLLDGATNDAQHITLHIGVDAYKVPASAWSQGVSGGHTVYSADWRPRGWSATARVKLTVDATSRRWSLDVRRGHIAQAMLRAAGGGLPIYVTSPGQAATPDIPVACTATFKAAVMRPAGVKADGSGGGGAVDMRNATISTVVDARHPRTARFALSGVHVLRSLLHKSGMDLAINGTALHVGPFTKKGNAYVATGCSSCGVLTVCRYSTTGEFALTLTGGDLSDHLRSEFMVQNVTLAVGAGRHAPSGTMVPVPTSIGRIQPLPATGELAR